MHQFLSNAPADPVTGHRQKLPAQKMPDVDFHKAVAGLGHIPEAERALGLVIDLEVPVGGRSGSRQRAGASQSRRPASMIPWTAYTLDVPTSFL